MGYFQGSRQYKAGWESLKTDIAYLVMFFSYFMKTECICTECICINFILAARISKKKQRISNLQCHCRLGPRPLEVFRYSFSI